MNSHLKGRIFERQGVSYLVLHEDGESPDLVWVREMSPRRTVKLIRADVVAESIGNLKVPAAGA